MDCFVGAETGALKSIYLRDATFSNVLPISNLQPKKDEITAMTFSGEDQTEVLIAQLDRSLRLYDSVTNGYSNLFTLEGEGRIRSVHVTPSQDIITACDSGAVKVWERNGNEKGSSKIGEGVLTMDVNKDGIIAIGGKGCLLNTIDSNTMQQTWKSRNVRNDWLDLEVPVWDMQARFMKDGRCIATTTGTHEVRWYDPRAQRKPVKRVEWLEEPVTALGIAGEHHAIVGNTRGEMAQFDLRNMVAVSKFKGQAGSLRCIQVHPSAPLVASCGIDRFFRVHDIKTRKIVSKVYCKARLNTLLLKDEISILTRVKEEEKDKEDWGTLTKKMDDDEYNEKEIKKEPEDEEEEDVWNELEEDNDDDDVKEIEPAVKRRKTTTENGRNDNENKKKNERKRKESEVDNEDGDDEEPKKRKKIVKLKRKGLPEESIPVMNNKKRRK